MRTLCLLEWQRTLRTPLFWLIAGVLQLLAGWLFIDTLERFLQLQLIAQQAEQMPSLSHFMMSRFLAPLALIHMLISPLLCMRSLAQSAHDHSLQLLFVSSLSERDILLGKYAALSGLHLALFAPIFLMLLSLAWVAPVDLALFAVAALLCALFIAHCMAISVLCASLALTPVASAFMAMSVILLLWMLGNPDAEMGQTLGVFAYFSPSLHLAKGLQGILDSRDISYFLISLLWLYTLAHYRLQQLRQRGLS